jgi:hypothetical protein
MSKKYIDSYRENYNERIKLTEFLLRHGVDSTEMANAKNDKNYDAIFSLIEYKTANNRNATEDETTVPNKVLRITNGFDLMVRNREPG